jgi:hypothetical protein
VLSSFTTAAQQHRKRQRTARERARAASSASERTDGAALQRHGGGERRQVDSSREGLALGAAAGGRHNAVVDQQNRKNALPARLHHILHHGARAVRGARAGGTAVQLLAAGAVAAEHGRDDHARGLAGSGGVANRERRDFVFAPVQAALDDARVVGGRGGELEDVCCGAKKASAAQRSAGAEVLTAAPHAHDSWPNTAMWITWLASRLASNWSSDELSARFQEDAVLLACSVV